MRSIPAAPQLPGTLLAALLAFAQEAPAQSNPPAAPGAYASATIGNGIISEDNLGGNTSGDRSMNWRSLELRFGREFDPARLGAGSLLGAGENLRVDVVHYNEGHPDNNHRDGFALQLTWARILSHAFSAEFSLGPYLSMNTTTLDGIEVNDGNLGALLSAGLRWRLDGYAPGLHLRLALNHVAMHNVHSSNSVQIGIGRHFGALPPYPAGRLGHPVRKQAWFGAAFGNSVTNQADTDGALGGSLEARQYGGKWAASLSGLLEGDDGARVDRRGVAAQFWFVQPVTRAWTLSAGAGPYLADNRREDGGWDLHALITLQAERSFSGRLKGFASFSRVKTFDEKNDRDLFRIGLLRSFGN